MEIIYAGAAFDELYRLPLTERKAIANAIEKLRMLGDELGFPHTSHIQGTSLRELRPRRGRSPWRAFYRRVGDAMVIAAIGPESQHDSRGFERAVRVATDRLDQIERDNA